jgi:hypothetical protein
VRLVSFKELRKMLFSFPQLAPNDLHLVAKHCSTRGTADHLQTHAPSTSESFLFIARKPLPATVNWRVVDSTNQRPKGRRVDVHVDMKKADRLGSPNGVIAIYRRPDVFSVCGRLMRTRQFGGQAIYCAQYCAQHS